jgi:hypothetical protein
MVHGTTKLFLLNDVRMVSFSGFSFSVWFFWSGIARWGWFALFFGGFPVVDRSNIERRSLVLLMYEI